MYTIYIIVDGGPAFVQECETADEARDLMRMLETKNPTSHFQCMELKFASRLHPQKALEEPVTEPINDDLDAPVD